MRKTNYTKGLAVATATMVMVGYGATIAHASTGETDETLVVDQVGMEAVAEEATTQDFIELVQEDVAVEATEEVVEAEIETVTTEVEVEQAQPKHGSRLQTKASNVLPGEIDDYLDCLNTTYAGVNYSVVREFTSQTYYFVNTTNGNEIIATYTSNSTPQAMFVGGDLLVATDNGSAMTITRFYPNGGQVSKAVESYQGVETVTMDYFSIVGDSVFFSYRGALNDGLGTTVLVEYDASSLGYEGSYSFAPNRLNPRPAITGVVNNGDTLTVTVDGVQVVVDKTTGGDDIVTPPTDGDNGDNGNGGDDTDKPVVPPTDGDNGTDKPVTPPTDGDTDKPVTPPTDGDNGNGGNDSDGGDNGDIDDGDGDNTVTPPADGDQTVTPPTDGDNTNPPTEDGDQDGDKPTDGDTDNDSDKDDQDKDDTTDKDDATDEDKDDTIVDEDQNKDDATTDEDKDDVVTDEDKDDVTVEVKPSTDGQNTNTTTGTTKTETLPKTGAFPIAGLAGLVSLFGGLKLTGRSKK